MKVKSRLAFLLPFVFSLGLVVSVMLQGCGKSEQEVLKSTDNENQKNATSDFKEVKFHDEKNATTKYGSIIVKRKLVQDVEKDVLYFSDKKLSKFDPYYITINKQWENSHGTSVFLIETSHGVNACPYMYFILLVKNNSEQLVSDSFGNCYEPIKKSISDETVTIDFEQTHDINLAQIVTIDQKSGNVSTKKYISKEFVLSQSKQKEDETKEADANRAKVSASEKSAQWYAFPGSLFQETVCKIADGDNSPSKLLKTFEALHKQYSIVDNEKVDGVVVDMTVRIEVGGLLEIRWIRGKEKCQKLLDRRNKSATDAVDSKNKAIDSKYGN